MDDSFHIDRYRPSDREKVFDLFRATYPPDYVAREIKQWDWKHDSNPFNAEAERYRIASRPHIWPFVRAAAKASDLAGLELRGEAAGNLGGTYCILLWSGDRLAGSLCPVPQRFMISGEQHWVILGSNFIVHPDFRGLHLSVRISLAMRADNAMNLNFGNASGQSSRRATHRTMMMNASKGAPETDDSRRLTPLLKPLDWYEVAGSLSGNAALRRGAAIVGSGIDSARRRVIERQPPPRLKILEVDAFDDRVDELWSRVHPDYRVIAVRDQRYLKWRYLARPDTAYRYVIALDRDQLAGYLVFRLADRDGMLCGYIIDCLVRDHSREVFAALLSFADDAIARDSAKAIICAVAPAEYRSTLWRAGYFPARMATTPHLNAQLYSSLPALRPFIDLDRWYMTMGDGNLDYSH